MKNRFKRWDTSLSRIENLTLIIAGIFLLLCTFVIFYGVIRRELNLPIGWAEEIARWSLVALTFLSLGPALRSNDHVSITLLASRFPLKFQKTLSVLISVYGVIFSIIFFYLGVMLVIETKQYTLMPLTVLPVPTWVLYLLIPIGLLILFIFYVDYMVRALRGLITFNTVESNDNSMWAINEDEMKVKIGQQESEKI